MTPIRTTVDNVIRSPDAVITRVGIAFLVLIGIVLLPDIARTHEVSNPASTFSIVGEGSVTAEPDVAFISSGVISEGKTAEDALSSNSTAMANVFKALEDAGIDRADIATSNFSVQPQYFHHRSKQGERPRPPEIVGYRVQNTVTVKIKDLAKTGMVISEVVKFGANQLGAITFDVSNKAALLDEARVKAVADATRKAKIYLEAAGVGLGPVVSIAEVDLNQPSPVRARALQAESLQSAPAVPVAGSIETLSVRVTMTWQIAQ